MQFLSWREIDFAGVVLAGLSAGYVMAIAGIWAGRVPGLVAFDIADVGRRYMVSDRPSAWIFGLVSHLINSVLLTLAWAMAIQPNVGWPLILSGIAWGLFLAFFFAGALVSPLAGIGFLGRKTGDWRFMLTNILLHILWGGLIGVLYGPR